MMELIGLKIGMGHTLNFTNMKTITSEQFKKIYGESAVSFTEPQKEPGYFQRVGGQLTETATGITEQSKKLFAGPQTQPDDTLGEQLKSGAEYFGVEVPRTALRVVGGVAKTAYTPIVEAPGIKNLLNAIGFGIKILSDTKPIQEIAKYTQPLADIILKMKDENPEIAKDIENALDIYAVNKLGRTKIGQMPVEEAGKKIASGAGKVAGTISGISGKVVDATVGIKDYAVSRFPKLLGIFSGENDDVIKYALKNPQAAEAGLKGGDVALRKVVQEGATNSLKLKNTFIESYTQAKNTLFSSYKPVIAFKDEIRDLFYKAFLDYKVKLLKDGTLDFTQSKIIANPGEIAKINAAWQAFNKAGKFTFSSLDDYKQLVGELTKFATDAGKSSKSPLLGTMYNNIDGMIKGNLPKNIASQYATLNSKFSKSIGLYNDLVKAFNSGDPFTKLANALGANKDSLRMLLEFYDSKVGAGTLSTVAGRSLAMEKQAAFGFLNPRSWIDFFISPEKQGEIILKVGSKLPK